MGLRKIFGEIYQDHTGRAPTEPSRLPEKIVPLGPRPGFMENKWFEDALKRDDVKSLPKPSPSAFR